MNNKDSAFHTNHLRADLKSRSIRGAAYMFLGRAALVVLNFASLMVLARLLTPFDFGVIAMVSVITGFIEIFRDAGFSTATIQRADITHAQVSTLFWANCVLSLLVALVIWAMSPLVAWFYDRPELVAVTKACAVGTFLSGLALQHSALLQRQLQLGRINAAFLLSQIAGITVAIASAMHGAGYWALVAKQVVTAGCNSALLWKMTGWRPGWPVRGSGVRPMIKFGGALTGARVLTHVARKTDDLLIGKVWGADALGFYSRAYSLLLLPTSELSAPLSLAVIPALSALQSDVERFRRYYRKAIELAAFLGYPLVVVLFVVADEMVLTVLGEQWRSSIEIFRMLGLATLIEVTASAGWWISISTGRGGRLLKLSMVTTPLLIAAIVAGLPWGAIGVAAALSIVRFVYYVPGLTYCYHGTPVRLSDFISAIWRPAVAAIVSGAVLYGIEVTWLDGLRGLVTRLTVMGGIFCMLYLGLFTFLPEGKLRLIGMLHNISYLAPSAKRGRVA